jgi:hypothetical protein
MLDVNVPGSIESVVDPPVIPIIKRPPFLGVAALAVLLINAGDATAIRPRADTRAMNSRRVTLPVVSKCSNSISFDIAHILLLNVYPCCQNRFKTGELDRAEWHQIPLFTQVGNERKKLGVRARGP